MLKPSLVAKVEQSSEYCQPLEELKTEETENSTWDFTSVANLPALTSCPTEEFNLAMGIDSTSPVDTDALLKASKYTGFTITRRERSDQPQELSLSRAPITGKLTTVLIVNKDDEKAKDSETLDFFSKIEIVQVTVLQPDPHAEADSVWSGLELITRKDDQYVDYCLKSHGYSEWKVYEEAEESKDDSKPYQVECAEIIRVKGQGPYIRFILEREHSVSFYSISPNFPTIQMHRFITK